MEVVVAIVVLAMAGTSALAAAGSMTRQVDLIRDREQEVRAANELLERVALWPAVDLDRHLGERSYGSLWLHVARPETHLYMLGVADSTNRQVILETVVYRPTSSMTSTR